MSFYDPESGIDLKATIGFDTEPENTARSQETFDYLNLKLAARGFPTYGDAHSNPIISMGASLIANLRERNRLLDMQLCPADQAIHDFLEDYLAEIPTPENQNWVPTGSFVLERHGLARMLSLPGEDDCFESDIVKSYRVFQGVCHNPDKDRRTTKGVFHIVEGGFPVPADKKEVPKRAFAGLLQQALNPPRELMRLPFTSNQPQQAELFASILLRPVVCPEVYGYTCEKSTEVRFFAPGGLVSNLDFVESIFGNAGDPYLPENDARIDVENWSGHTGCVILAPHLINLTKREIGLPHVSNASERQKKDGMCWEQEDELYNDGGAFKITCRDDRGVIVTLVADNYFGYCKKEVKTQLSYAANLMGLCEEEHAGGALAFPRADLGDNFELSNFHPEGDHSFAEVLENYRELMNVDPRGFGIDKTYPDIYYLPENIRITIRDQRIVWTNDGQEHELKLQPDKTYVLPSGFNIEMVKPQEGARWRLVGQLPEGTFCHKPCTVSGGGKSEISKPITDSMISGPVLTYDFNSDFDRVESIIEKDFGDRYAVKIEPGKPSRPLLSPDRSLGSALRLLTQNPEFTDEYNAWIARIPRHVRDLVMVVKRFYNPEWGDDWRSRFSVDSVNGLPGHELKYGKRKLASLYSRVGFSADGSWRTFALRKDFFASRKLQTEDDISASVVVPANRLQNLHPELKQPSYKFVKNCEYRLFQRPDEAIVRGYDVTAESDFSKKGNFFSNYQPLSHEDAKNMIEDAILFDEFSEPIQNLIRGFADIADPDYFVSTSNPRVVNGRPSENPRYLQNRPDLSDTRSSYLVKMGARLYRRVPLDHPVAFPVNSVLPGRRNNPSDKEAKIRPLAVYNPIHYQELPELFMEFISSLTGKSPSTTGAGSEGALTKGPFNAMPPIIDLNNSLVSYLVTGHSCFTTSAGYIGPKHRVDHDISLLIPEVWSRMFIHEREPDYLIENGFLEKLYDFDHKGKKVLASRLGYRINEKFVNVFFGRVFSDPENLFGEQLLQPEKQDMDDYVDGIDNIVSTQKRIANLYFEDETIELACPPLKALLHIMADGDYEGQDVHSPEIRELFSVANLMQSEWYRDRLVTQRKVQQRHYESRIKYLQGIQASHESYHDFERLRIDDRFQMAQDCLEEVCSDGYLKSLEGTIGADPAVLR